MVRLTRHASGMKKEKKADKTPVMKLLKKSQELDNTSNAGTPQTKANSSVLGKRCVRVALTRREMARLHCLDTG